MLYHMNFIIQKVNINDVVYYDKQKYNTNNHWIDNTPPKDYHSSMENTRTNKWINKFRTNYMQITIDDPKDIKWMIAASEISSKTGAFTKLYDDELDEFLDKYANKYKHIFDGTGYFVRTENVSLKCGQHGVGPYFNLRQIIESIVSCTYGHTPIYETTTKIVIYLLDWVKIDDHNEFRVFVTVILFILGHINGMM